MIYVRTIVKIVATLNVFLGPMGLSFVLKALGVPGVVESLGTYAWFGASFLTLLPLYKGMEHPDEDIF